jgi:hypothetical protein
MMQRASGADDERTARGDAEAGADGGGRGEFRGVGRGDAVGDGGDIAIGGLATVFDAAAGGVGDGDDLACAAADPAVEGVGEGRLEAAAGGAGRDEEMLGEDVSAASGEFDGEGGGKGGAAVVGVDDVEFPGPQLAAHEGDGGPIEEAALFDREMGDVLVAGAVGKDGDARGCDEGNDAGGAQAAGEIEHVALGAREYVGVGEEGDFQGGRGSERAFVA